MLETGIAALPGKQASSWRALGLLRRVARWEMFVASGAFALFLWLSLVVPSSDSKVFNTPDETSNYLFAKTFAQEGRLWYSRDYTALDQENLLHPRGALTHEGRIVPYSYLGVPIIYGLLQRAATDDARYIALVLAALSAAALYRAASLLFAAKAWEVGVVLLAFTPLIYHLNKPYMNATPALTAVFVGIWLFVRYFRFSSRRDLILASAAAALAILFRYEYILFITPLFLWALYVKYHTILSRAFVGDTVTYFVIIVILFILPIGLLNQGVYGDWNTYGPSLFSDLYFPERGLSEDVSLIERIIASLRRILLPSYPFEPLQVLQNIPRLTVWLMPVFTLTALSGAYILITRRYLKLSQLLALALVMIYILSYSGSGATFLSFGAPTFSASIVRYWLPFYTILFFLALFALRATRDGATKAVLVLGLILTGPISVYSLADGSLRRDHDIAISLAGFGERVILPNTETDALIYASFSDKRIALHRDVATWWVGGTKSWYESTKVAASIARVFPTGRPLYVFEERDINLAELNEVLSSFGLRTDPVGETGLHSVALLEAEQGKEQR